MVLVVINFFQALFFCDLIELDFFFGGKSSINTSGRRLSNLEKNITFLNNPKQHDDQKDP